MHPMGLLVVVLAILAWPVTVFVVLGYWAQWLVRRASLPSSASMVAYVLLAIGALSAVLAPVASAGVHMLTEARERTVIPSAMRAFAVAWTTAVLVNTLWLLFATWRWRWSVRADDEKRAGPYR